MSSPPAPPSSGDRPPPHSSGREALDWTLEAACLQATVEGCSLDAALLRHFDYLHEFHPYWYAALCTYLEATGNSELLALALSDERIPP